MPVWQDDYWPGAPSSVHTPVVDGTVTSITGAQLPDSRGLLLWLDGDTTGAVLKGAYTTDPLDFVVDGSVDAGDIVTIDATSYVKARCTVFTDEVDVYYVLVYLRTSDSHGRTEFWIADDPADPLAGWSLLSVLQDAVVGASGSNWDNVRSSVAGTPFIDGATWHYAGSYWDSALGQHDTRQGIWLSSDSGATWTLKATFGNTQNGIFVGGQIARSPNTGDLYCNPGNSSVGQSGAIFVSTDNGATWGQTVTYSGTGTEPVYGAEPHIVPVCGYLGETLWIDLDPGTFTGRLWSFTDDYMMDVDGTEKTDQAVDYFVTLLRSSTKVAVLDLRLYVFSVNTVQASGDGPPPPPGTWVVGLVEFG